MDHFPVSTVKSFLTTESTLDRHAIAARAKEILQDEGKFAFLKLLLATMSERLQERQDGLQNDLTQMAAITQLDLAPIACPTLIMHGAADKDVPPRHGEYAHASIAGSELYRITGGSHIGFWLAAEAYQAQDYALSWLREKMRGRTVPAV